MKVPTRVLHIAAIGEDCHARYNLDSLAMTRFGRTNVASATDNRMQLVAAWKADDDEIAEAYQLIPKALATLARRAARATNEDGVVFGTSESGCWAEGREFSLRAASLAPHAPSILDPLRWSAMDGTSGVSIQVDAKQLCTLLQTMIRAMHEPYDAKEPAWVTLTVEPGSNLALTARSNQIDIAALLNPHVAPCASPAWNPLDLNKQ